MLRLVHPAHEGQGTEPPKKRRGLSPALSLSPDEIRHLRTAIKNTARKLGSWALLANTIGMPLLSLRHAVYASKHRPSGTLAIRVAKVAGVSVETVLTGKLAVAGRCPTCDAHIAVGGAR